MELYETTPSRSPSRPRRRSQPGSATTRPEPDHGETRRFRDSELHSIAQEVPEPARRDRTRIGEGRSSEGVPWPQRARLEGVSCIFCGRSPTRPEHIFGRRWLESVMPSDEPFVHRHVRAGERAFDRSWQKKEADLKVNCV